MSALSSPAAQAAAVKKKHVRFASMDDDDDDHEEQEEDTLFDKRKDAERGGLKSALKAAKRRTKPGSGERVKVVDGGRGGGYTACGRWMVSLTLCASFLGLGMGISVVGPTFEDLALNVNTDISNISYIFIGRSAGYIGGSLLGGVLFDCMNPNLLLGFSMLITACGMCAIPFCKHALLLTGFMSSIGISMGILDTGGNVLILNTWGAQAGPHMQALHFSFAAGAFVSPIIAKLLFGHNTAGGHGVDIMPKNSTNSPVALPIATDDHTLIQFIHGSGDNLKSMWAYIVIGLFVLLTSFPFFVLCVRGGTSHDKARASSAKHPVARHHTALVVLLFFFFFAYVGAEVAYGSFIFTFAKDYAQMNQAQAAGLNSLFWATFAACRGLAIFFASCMYPGTMILLSLVGTTLSSLFLCLFSKDKIMLWVCTALYGASMSSTFPSGISWLEQYTTVTGRSAAVFVVGAALGEMVLPGLVGFLLGKIHGHPLLMYLALITATFTAIIFPVMYKLASVSAGPIRKRHGIGRLNADDSEYRQALLDSGELDEEEEEENEADQWNDADFEVIEMDDAASLISSPGKDGSPPDIGSDSGLLTSGAQLTEPAKGSSSSDTISLVGDSPKRKLLLFPDRVKRD
ncbi:sodium-dependent glucose transporter 1 [Corythoichthys intestinalis]|uniref:sodium-dependent glucose transporter 1 n=1 Tax=Corythoichthys intestinalis TaxID=161448 RepID=UPI0025A66C65|nr:sodium-dependent glucose transporter 1 [Corythoichthys intestinalis]XP_061806198.1 sodium-dependent glucose transporter 1-like [Nerophis lumbriciformis]